MKHFTIVSFLITILSLNTAAQSTTLKVGDVAPAIEGVDQYGDSISSKSIVKDGYLAVVFYRGNWCPYCMKHLSELSESFEELEAENIEVILVTPENTAGVDKTLKESNTSYSVIADTSYAILDAYQSKFKISDKTVPRYLNVVTKRTREANGNEEDILTVPATFLLNNKHQIIWMHYDKDYTERSKVEDIISAVKKDITTE